MLDIQMVLARDLVDVSVNVYGSARPVPFDATGDFLAGSSCRLLEPVNSQVTMVEFPFADGEVAHMPMHMSHLLPG